MAKAIDRPYCGGHGKQRERPGSVPTHRKAVTGAGGAGLGIGGQLEGGRRVRSDDGTTERFAGVGEATARRSVPATLEGFGVGVFFFDALPKEGI
jgi:hypothetical protein